MLTLPRIQQVLGNSKALGLGDILGDSSGRARMILLARCPQNPSRFRSCRAAQDAGRFGGPVVSSWNDGSVSDRLPRKPAAPGVLRRRYGLPASYRRPHGGVARSRRSERWSARRTSVCRSAASICGCAIPSCHDIYRRDRPRVPGMPNQGRRAAAGRRAGRLITARSTRPRRPSGSAAPARRSCSAGGGEWLRPGW